MIFDSYLIDKLSESRYTFIFIFNEPYDAITFDI